MHPHHADREKNLSVALLLNVVFTAIELVGGILTNSLAILSDALHDLGDSISLAAALVMERYAKKTPDAKRTFGYARLSLFSSFFAALVLVVGSIYILFEAIPRLLAPESVYVPGMIALALLGIVFNGIGMLRLRNGKSLNERVFSLHLFEDVLGWVAILIGSILILIFNIPILDPIITMGYTLFILWNVSKLLGQSVNLLMQGVPKDIDLGKVEAALKQVEGVVGMHDVHVWSLEGETTVFTAHVVVTAHTYTNSAATKDAIRHRLQEFGIGHPTIELETEGECPGGECADLHGTTRNSSQHIHSH